MAEMTENERLRIALDQAKKAFHEIGDFWPCDMNGRVHLIECRTCQAQAAWSLVNRALLMPEVVDAE